MSPSLPWDFSSVPLNNNNNTNTIHADILTLLLFLKKLPAAYSIFSILSRCVDLLLYHAHIIIIVTLGIRAAAAALSSRLINPSSAVNGQKREIRTCDTCKVNDTELDKQNFTTAKHIKQSTDHHRRFNLTLTTCSARRRRDATPACTVKP